MERERRQQYNQQPPQTQKGTVCSAEEYLVRMLMLLRNESDQVDVVAQETNELLLAVRECLEGCRWELLQEAWETLGRLIK
jgi:hypothetical protein